MTPREFLDRISAGNGGVFDALDEVKLRAGAQGQSWPPWCLLPDSVAAPLLAARGIVRQAAPLDFDAVMTAYAWRRARHSVSFLPRVVDAMTSSRVVGWVAVEVLRALPGACAYIACPGLADLEGFFVRLDCELVRGQPALWLRFLALRGDAVVPWALRLGVGQTVEQAMLQGRSAVASQVRSDACASNAVGAELEPIAHALVSLTLAVCYVASGPSAPDGLDLGAELAGLTSFEGAQWLISVPTDFSGVKLQWLHPSGRQLEARLFPPRGSSQPAG